MRRSRRMRRRGALRIPLAVALLLSWGGCPVEEDVDDYVPFHITIELVDEGGIPRSCGELGIVQLMGETWVDERRERCCPFAESSVRLELFPDEYRESPVEVWGFDTGGVGIAYALSRRFLSDREIVVQLGPSDTGMATTIYCE